jgi:threonine synthase
VALSALRRAERFGGPVVVMSTAHAAKFPEAVAKACGVTPELPRGVADLAGRPERFDRLPAEAETIKAYVRAFAEG